MCIRDRATYLEIITAQQSLLSAQLNEVSDTFQRMQAVINPVSYTHLDVYKRQDQRSSECGLLYSDQPFRWSGGYMPVSYW